MNNRDEHWNRVLRETFQSTLGPLIAQARQAGCDTTRFLDEVAKEIGCRISENFGFRPRWQIDRYKPGAYQLIAGREIIVGRPFDRSAFDGNLALNEGINAFWTLFAGGSETAYSNANARLGTGTSSTAAAASQTGLLADAVFVGMDAGYPTYGSSQQYIAKGTFGTSTANQSWQEFSLDNGSSANKNFNRKCSDEGTKPSGQIWVLTLTVTGA